MASLTHVCMWSNKGWKRITASEAAKIHPGGTVSAHSGLFMCELCGQYVILVDGNRQVRHFRHSSSKKSKDCPERVSGIKILLTYNPQDYELPIRIKNITNKDFELEIGFIRVPEKLLTEKMQIEIKPSSHEFASYIYSSERLNSDTITYLSVGGIPCDEYRINVSGTKDEIKRFWPKEVQGINSSGTLFDESTGKKLVHDSDVIVGEKYYLLCRGNIYSNNTCVSIQKITSKIVSYKTWNLYEIVANDYDENTARFFLEYHCRLTEKPVKIQAVWPVYIETPYVIKYNQNSVIMHIIGNGLTTRAFPYTNILTHKCSDSNETVIETICNTRQQLISAGRTNVLQYAYLWKEPLTDTAEKPLAEVVDKQGVTIFSGSHNELPKGKILRITVPYDGKIVIRLKGMVIEKRELHANIPTEIDSIIWNMEISVYVGLDSVWKASFDYLKKKEISDEEEILHRLSSYRGVLVTVPHTLGNLAGKLQNYPQIRRWLYECIRSGYMSKQAYRELQMLIVKKNL